MDWKDLDRLRNPGFSFGRRGYDRHEVDRFLEQLVDWLETDAARDLGHVAITRKLELVGKSTTHIMLAAEQEAEELMRKAEADIAELRKQAEADARAVRAEADEYAAKAREDATAEASETHPKNETLPLPVAEPGPASTPMWRKAGRGEASGHDHC